MISPSYLAMMFVLAAFGSSRARAEPTAADGGEAAEVDGSDSLVLGKLSPDEIRALLERYRAEPSASQVVEAALRVADSDPQHFASMLSRARWRGLLPSLAFGARRGQGVDLRSTVTDDIDRFTSGDDLVLSATLRFELGRLLYADEEVSITREARAARAARLELARSVIHWYFVRRRLQLERDALGRSSVARELRIAEIEAVLDAFTNGAFGRMIARARTAWTTEESTHVSAPP
ncbi:MAG TPA: hypothetical protein VJV78_01590 [Polyangiales bacterium]|nr:hypothetical protein [Polyangiales bacterium]